MYFHFHSDDLEYDLLSDLFKRTVVEEMMSIEKLAERILFLKSEVEMKKMQDVQKIHNIRKMFEMAAGMETGSVKEYIEWANECSGNAGSASKNIFEVLVDA